MEVEAMSEQIYPFGSKLKPVVQKDRGLKKIFVLGVYASAVHARWYGPDGKIRVRALAVASEPEIFWRGDEEEAEKIINAISIPSGCGYLKSDARFNGPSGKTLDEQFLKPLGYIRDDAWLCDLLPETRLNKGQLEALKREYLPLVEKGLLPEVTIPPVPRHFSNDARSMEIVAELMESKAELLITLGDIPLREFVARYKKEWNRLSVFGTSRSKYGKSKRHELAIDGKTIELLPLVHPRQARRMGASSIDWYNLHKYWVDHARDVAK
jgi:hypothetical protein